jgi:hypothetical protein
VYNWRSPAACSLLPAQDYGGRSYLVVEAASSTPAAGSRIITLILGAASQVAADELKPLADSTLKSLSIALQVGDEPYSYLPACLPACLPFEWTVHHRESNVEALTQCK